MYSKNKKIRIMYNVLDEDNDALDNTIGLVHKKLSFNISKGRPFIHFFINEGLENNLDFVNKHWDVGFDKGAIFLERDESGTPAFFEFLKRLAEDPDSTSFLFVMKKISESENYNKIVSQTDGKGNNVLHILASLRNCDISHYVDFHALTNAIKDIVIVNDNGQTPLHLGVASNGDIKNIENTYNAMDVFKINKSLDHKDSLGKTVSDYAVINRNHLPFVCKTGYLKENLTKDMIHAIVHNISAYMRVKGYHDSQTVFIVNSVLNCMSKDEKNEFLSVLASPHPYLLSFSKLDSANSIHKHFESIDFFQKKNVSSNMDYLTNNPKFCIDLYDNVINDIEKDFFDNAIDMEEDDKRGSFKL